jgi:hypothetical protein
VDFRSLRGAKDEPTDNITDFRIAPFRLFGEELGGTQIFYKDWGAGTPMPLISHVTGCAWTVHPIGAR